MAEARPNPSASVFVFDVLVPMLFPVAARAGDALVVEPGHPTRPMVVMRHTAEGAVPIRLGPPNFGALLLLWDEGVIVERSSASVLLFLHPRVEPELAARVANA